MAAAIPLAIGAVAGGLEGVEQNKQTRRFNKSAAEANRFADVTGRFTDLRKEGPGFLGGALKGASSFGGLGGAFGGSPSPGGGGGGGVFGGLAQQGPNRIQPFS